MALTPVTFTKATVKVDGTDLGRLRFIVRRTGEAYALDNRGRRVLDGTATTLVKRGDVVTAALADGRTVVATRDCGCGARR